jgi:hypothetical protein
MIELVRKKVFSVACDHCQLQCWCFEPDVVTAIATASLRLRTMGWHIHEDDDGVVLCPACARL